MTLNFWQVKKPNCSADLPNAFWNAIMHFKDFDRVHDLNLNHFQHNHGSCSVRQINNIWQKKRKKHGKYKLLPSTEEGKKIRLRKQWWYTTNLQLKIEIRTIRNGWKAWMQEVQRKCGKWEVNCCGWTINSHNKNH